MELKGEIIVDFKTNVPVYIMYPFNFPKDPPFLRIVNPNPKEFTPTPNYKALQSESDAKSYLLNNCLQAIKGWKANDSHVVIIYW